MGGWNVGFVICLLLRFFSPTFQIASYLLRANRLIVNSQSSTFWKLLVFYPLLLPLIASIPSPTAPNLLKKFPSKHLGKGSHLLALYIIRKIISKNVTGSMGGGFWLPGCCWPRWRVEHLVKILSSIYCFMLYLLRQTGGLHARNNDKTHNLFFLCLPTYDAVSLWYWY